MNESLFYYKMKIYKNNILIKEFDCPRMGIPSILERLLFNNLNYKIEIIYRNGDVLSMTHADFLSSNS